MRWMVMLVAALVLLAAPATAQQAPRQAPKRVALVIGNSTYVNAGRLANPANDARLVTAALRRAGFQTVDAKTDLGLLTFQRALRDFRASAAGAQVALVYYAGHGIEGNGRNWLLPTDAVLASEADLDYEAVPLDLVLATLVGADLRVVVLDACRNNPFGRSWGTSSRSVQRGLSAIEIDDVLVIYAAAPGQTAGDGAGGNSPFATALARWLPEPGLPIQLLGGSVRDDVLRATNRAQRPYVSQSMTGTPFYLVASASAPPARPTPAPAARPVQAPPPSVGREVTHAPLSVFRDCGGCPEMIALPAGRFSMGSPAQEPKRGANEGPVHAVAVPAFAIGKLEVTAGEWEACVRARGCTATTTAAPAATPATNVSWEDARAYVAWLNGQVAGRPYRLPSEAEWEYAARAGSTAPFAFGASPAPTSAAYNWETSYNGSSTRTPRPAAPSPAGSFAPNAFGLYDVHGNVFEWVEDCYQATYAGAPTNGAAVVTSSCPARVLRGGSWLNRVENTRAAFRESKPPSTRNPISGFRVARTLP